MALGEHATRLPRRRAPALRQGRDRDRCRHHQRRRGCTAAPRAPPGDLGHVAALHGGDTPCTLRQRRLPRGGRQRPGGRASAARAEESTPTTAPASDPARASRATSRAAAAVREAGRDIGDVLAACVSMLNPSVIVIGGAARPGRPRACWPASARSVYGRSLPLATGTCGSSRPVPAATPASSAPPRWSSSTCSRPSRSSTSSRAPRRSDPGVARGFPYRNGTVAPRNWGAYHRMVRVAWRVTPGLSSTPDTPCTGVQQRFERRGRDGRPEADRAADRRLADLWTGHPRRWAILGVLVTSLLVVVLDNTILNIALPTIQRDLRRRPEPAACGRWTPTSWCSRRCCSPGACWATSTGARSILVIGLLIFAIASAACAFATTPTSSSSSAALMGIGGAAVLPVTLAIITVVFPPHERGRAIGAWAGAVGGAVALGPVLGGLLLENPEWTSWLTDNDWGGVFLINVPIVIDRRDRHHQGGPGDEEPAAAGARHPRPGHLASSASCCWSTASSTPR